MKLLLLAALIPTLLFAEVEEAFDIDATKQKVIDQRENYFQTSTPYKITPNVNPITGDLIEEEVDLVIAGSEPLSVRRFYNHTAIYDPRYGGWRYNPESYLVANFEWPQQECFAAAGELNGGIASFKASDTPYHYTFNAPMGYAHFNPSGQTHPLNTKITYIKNIDRKKKLRFSWQGNDRLLSVYDAVSKIKTTRTYNALGNITQEILSSGYKLLHAFDAEGRRIESTLPDNSTIDYVYQGAYLYSINRNGLHFTYTARDLEGHLIQADLPIGSIAIERDALSRWKHYDSPFYHSKFPKYDPVGNLLRYHYQDSLGKVDCVYKYDDLNQLISENDHTYSFDSLNNRLRKDDLSHQVNHLCQIIDDGRYEYDLDGNLIFDGEWQYTYDTQNRLIALENKNKRIECEYDPFHRRLSKKVFANGQVKHERYLWDGDNEIGVMNEQGQIEQLRILGEGLGAEIGAAVLYELKGKAYIPIHDHRGCVVTLIDMESKQPLESYRYTAFGEELTDGRLSPWRFASKRVDETGLIFFGRRYYHPELGRWISQDPQGFEDGPNLYAYLHNCPLTDFDLYGLFGFGSMWNNAQHFMWGMLEGSAYHFQNMASSFCMRDFSQPEWKPKSLMQNQNMVSTRGMDWVEKSVLPFTYEARRLGDVSQNDCMRARGRAFGEQAITLGGLFSAFSLGKNLLNAGPRLQEMTTQGLSRDYLFSGKP